MGSSTRTACEGLVVLDLGQGMAGAMPGMILGDNGAEVVKVEPPTGDWARGEPGFLMWNRNKRGIVLDLKCAKHHDRMMDLIRRADIFIESFRPGVALRLGVDWSDLRQRNPRLIYCSIGGFGSALGYRAMAAYESTVSAAMGRMVGLDHLSGASEGHGRSAPIFTSIPISSYGAAQLAVQGILAALNARERTGRGECVRTSLVQGAAAFLMRQEMPRDGGRGAQLVSAATHAGIELCFMTARCKDGRFLQMCARQDAQFRNWIAAMGMQDVLSDPRFSRAPLGIERVEDVADLDMRIRSHMATKTQDQWMALFTTEYDVGCDPFLTPAEFLAHPQMVENNRVVELDDPIVGRCRQVGPLVVFSDTPSVIEKSAPALGEDTDLVFSSPEALGPLFDANLSPAPVIPRRSKPPLDGVTVVELE
jgi:crotonobetainyl-CoA:carnitine CoA-transferase CaiB-like acyl-CoA transferase